MKNYYLFPTVATLFFAFMNLYVYKSLKQRFKSYKFIYFAKFIFISVAILFCICEMIYFISLRAEFLKGFAYKFCVFTAAATFSMFCVCLTYDVFDTTLNTIKFNRKRRKFLKLGIDITFIIISVSYLLKGFCNAIKKPNLTNTQINIKNLSQDINLIVISDIHLGEFLQKDFLQDIVSAINKTEHDAVLIVGDMFDTPAKKLKNSLEPLNDLKKPVFFVTGNHEYYHGATQLVKAVQKYGVKFLNNENVKIKGINLVGVNDKNGERFGVLKPDFNRALKGIDKNIPTVLMAHQPKFVNENVKDEVDLCICGHTHAGQIFPFSLLVILDQKYLYGLYNDSLKQIYVSSGVGFWGPPMRILAPAEIALLKLRKA